MKENKDNEKTPKTPKGPTRPKTTPKGPKIIKDSREQEGWSWPNMEVRGLKTGDYTLEGFEDLFVIERKASVSEVAKNITEARFTRELERLKEFPHAYLLLEFSVSDIMSWPASSAIPRSKQRFIKMRGPYILKKLMEYTMEYNVQVLFAASKGQEVAECLFKRIVEKYGKISQEESGRDKGDSGV